jgi:hypothetical protein
VTKMVLNSNSIYSQHTQVQPQENKKRQVFISFLIFQKGRGWLSLSLADPYIVVASSHSSSRRRERRRRRRI